MGKLKQFSIRLNSPQLVFYCGQYVSGQVDVELTEPMKMRGIRLQFEGKGEVRWTETHTSGSGKNRHTTTRTYSASETYFDVVLNLYGSQGGDSIMHPAGSYTYYFQYQIPYGCPSSFEGSVGRVRYKMKAVIDKPWKFDHKTIVVFTVLNLLDLNRDPFSLSTPCLQDSKTLCCLCCASGPITVQSMLERGGYVPGERIRIRADIENHSNREMTNSYAELIQCISYHATSKTKQETRTLTQVYQGSIPPGGSDTWNNVELHVPPVPPSRLDGCSIIDIQYFVKFVVDPSGPSISLKLNIPVLIGSLPLLSVMGLPAAEPIPSAMPPPMSAPSAPVLLPSAPPMQPPATDPFSGTYPNLPPPSYAECAFGKVNVRDEGDEKAFGSDSFAPAYSYYDWSKSAFG